MNKLYYKLLLLFLLDIPLVILQVGAKICCITQSSDNKFKDLEADDVIQWQSINDTQIASCTQLQFFPNNYTLTKNLKVTSVNDLIINCSGVVFHCNSYPLIINNSTIESK